MPKIMSPYTRVFILWLALVAIWLLIGGIGEFVWGTADGGYILAGHVVSAILTTIAVVPLIVLVRRAIDKQTTASLGLPLELSAFKPFLIGALAFLVPSALGFALVLGAGWVEIMPTAPIVEIVAFIPPLIVLVFLLEALPEELAFRGYIQSALGERHSPLIAAVMQALLFGVWGAALWTISTGAIVFDRLVMFFAIALVLGLVRVMTGSVWAAIGLHVGFQTVAQLLLNSERAFFAVTGGQAVQLIALGIVPFAMATTIVGLFYRDNDVWKAGRTPVN